MRNFHVAYDYNATELNEQYDEILDDLLAHCPVARSEDGEGYWVVNRYDDVRRVLQNWETFRSGDGFVPNRPEGMPFWYPVECDPPFHTELRKVLSPFLSPKAVAALEPEIRRHADSLIDDFIDAGEVEIVSQFANSLPGRVFCSSIAAMPLEDMPYLQKCFQAGIVGPRDGRAASMKRAQDYIAAYLEKRAGEAPRGDVVDAILAFEWPEYEFVDKAGTLSQLTQGGVGTTGFVFAGSLLHLAQFPDARRALHEDLSKVPTAVEEFLRFYASAPHLGRRAVGDTEVGGAQIRNGDFVLVSVGAASRDPAVCPFPSRVDIDRTPNRHLAFGAGPHRCVGSHLARLNLRIGLERFLARIPDFTLPDEFVPQYQVGTTRDMVSLPLRFDGTP